LHTNLVSAIIQAEGKDSDRRPNVITPGRFQLGMIFDDTVMYN